MQREEIEKFLSKFDENELGYELEIYSGNDYRVYLIEENKDVYDGSEVRRPMFRVFKIVNNENDDFANIKVTGFHDSWSGGYWSAGFSIVELREVSVMKWVEV